jgi:hypothetical protein
MVHDSATTCPQKASGLATVATADRTGTKIGTMLGRTIAAEAVIAIELPSPKHLPLKVVGSMTHDRVPMLLSCRVMSGRKSKRKKDAEALAEKKRSKVELWKQRQLAKKQVGGPAAVSSQRLNEDIAMLEKVVSAYEDFTALNGTLTWDQDRKITEE